MFSSLLVWFIGEANFKQSPPSLNHNTKATNKISQRTVAGGYGDNLSNNLICFVVLGETGNKGAIYWVNKHGMNHKRALYCSYMARVRRLLALQDAMRKYSLTVQILRLLLKCLDAFINPEHNGMCNISIAPAWLWMQMRRSHVNNCNFIQSKTIIDRHFFWPPVSHRSMKYWLSGLSYSGG